MARGADGSIVIDTALDNSGFEAGSAKLAKACDSLIDKIGDMGARLQSGFASTGGIDRMAAQAAMAQHQIDVLQDKLKAFGNTPVKTEDYEGLENALKKAEAELLKYQDRQNLMRDMGVSEQTAQWQRLAVQIANTEAIIRQYRMEMEYMRRSGQDTVMGYQTEQYKDLIGKITIAKEQLAQFSAEQARAAAKADRLKRINATFEKIGKSIKGAIKRLFSFNSASRSSARATGGLIRQLTSLKTLLISRIKSIFIAQIMKAVQDGIQALAKYSREVDAAISGMRNAFKELGANVSVAVSGLLNAIAPVVTQIINWLSTLVSYISAFIAMLSGKNTVMVAKKQTDSYAKSLDKTAKSAKKAQLALAGFDEINNLTTQKDSGSGGTSPGSMFEEKEIDSLLPATLKDWFNRLKADIQAGDWYGVGATIAEGINTAVSTAHKAIKETDFKKIGANIAKFINGSVENTDWREIGATLSDGISGLLDTVTEFLETLNWQSLGESIADFIMGIKWGEITQKLAGGIGTLIGGVIQLLWGFIKEGIEEQIAGWAGEDGEMTATEFIHGFVNTWSDIKFWNFTNIAAPLGNKLAESLFGIDEQTRQAGVDAIQAFFTGILSKSDFGTWINEHIYTPFMTWLRKLFGLEGAESTVMVEQGERITEGLRKGITNKLKDIKSWVQLKVFTPIKNAVKTAFGVVGNVANKFLDVGSALVAGVKKGISNAWNSFKTWVEEKFRGIIDGVKGVFGIHSPSKVFAQIGGYLMSGLAEGIDDDKATVLRSVADIASSAEDAFDGKTLSVNTAGFDGVLSVLDRIAAKISDITDSLGNLHVPAMATGEVIPYRAKIVDTTYAGGMGDGGDLKQIIIDALRAAGLSNITIQAFLDGQKVYDSVVDYSKRDIRRTGRYPILGE